MIFVLRKLSVNKDKEGMILFMNKAKKNQIVIYSIVLMLVVAGYLNYIENDKSIEISANTQNTTNIGDATLVSNNEIKEEIKELEKETNHDKTESKKQEEIQSETNEKKTESVSSEESSEDSVSSVTVTFDEDDEYFANSKLEREKMYSQMLENYQKILENESISEEQKSIAATEITRINNTRNSIMICENLIAIKGFDEAVILANGESVNIIIKTKELKEEEIAQIQNIITREIGTKIENIHIMKK